MGKKKKAPEYTSATYDTGGLFGSSTTNKQGTTYKPTNWISNTMSTVGDNINPTLNSLISGDFSQDPNYQAYQNNLNRQMTQAYDTDVLSNLANRGLMRSSGLQSATNAFADTLANNQMNLYDQYYNRQANNLSNLLNTSNTLYNYITGVNAGSQNQAKAINDYNMAAYQAENQAKANLYNLWGSLANSAGSIAGGAKK